MTEQQEAAMRQALEALIEVTGWQWAGPMRVMDEVEDAITALTAALEQPAQQEPVAYMYPDDYERMTSSETFCTVFSVECGSPTQGKTTVALYTHPAPEPVIDKSAAIRIATALGWEPKREPLTDEQISKIDWKQNETLHDFARAIEAAHGITGEKK